MGHIVLPDGKMYWSSKVGGTVQLKSLVDDACCVDYTNNYRMMCLRCLLAAARDGFKNYLLPFLPNLHTLEAADRYMDALRNAILREVSNNFDANKWTQIESTTLIA